MFPFLFNDTVLCPSSDALLSSPIHTLVQYADFNLCTRVSITRAVPT